MSNNEKTLGKHARSPNKPTKNGKGYKNESENKLLLPLRKKCLEWVVNKQLFEADEIDKYYEALICAYNCSLCGKNGGKNKVLQQQIKEGHRIPNLICHDCMTQLIEAEMNSYIEGTEDHKGSRVYYKTFSLYCQELNLKKVKLTEKNNY